MTNKLYRSQTERMLGGVCGGLAKYLNVDTTIVRLFFIVLTLLGGFGNDHQAVRQLIDLAMLANNMLKGEALSAFVKRSISLL